MTQKRSKPFSEIEPREIEFLWRGRVPAGMITLLGGLPGKGKSMLSFRIAADVSLKHNVLVSNVEDRLREVSRPRMAAAGADLDRVHVFEPPLRPFPEGFEQLAAEVRRHDAKLVVLDPWAGHVAFQPGNTVLTRDALDPIEKLCEETGVAIVIVTHQIKNAGPNTNPLVTVGGSSNGLIGLARAVYLVGINPGDSDAFAMAPAKFNIGAWPKALAFELDVSGGFADDDDPEAGMLLLRGECDVTDRDLVRAQYAEQSPPKESKSERAAAWLSRYLWEANGPVEPKAVVGFAQMEDPPITARQLKRAAQELSATDPDGGRGAKWELPDDMREMLDAEYGVEGGDE